MKRYKGTLAFGIIFLIAGVVMLVVAFSNDANAASGKFTEHTYTATAEVTRYNLDLGAGNFVTEFYDGEAAVVEYSDSSKYQVTIDENNGVLTVKAKYKWWVFFGINFNSSSLPLATVKIPKSSVPDISIDLDAGKFSLSDGTYGNVTVDLNAGDFNVGNIICQKLLCDVSAGSLKVAGADCTELDCDISAGSVNISKATCNSVSVGISAGSASISNIDCSKAVIDVSAGGATLGFCDKEENYSISVSKSAGNCNVNNRTSDTGKSIEIDISAGKVTCNFTN